VLAALYIDSLIADILAHESSHYWKLQKPRVKSQFTRRLEMESSEPFIQAFSGRLFLKALMRKQLIGTIAVISMLAVAGSVNAAIVQYKDYSDFQSTTIASYAGVDIHGAPIYTTNSFEAHDGGSDGVAAAGGTPMTFSITPFLTGYSWFEVGLTFGNDDSGISSTGGIFVVTLSMLDGLNLLGSVQVTSNGNNISDQFIGLSSSVAFDNVRLDYDTGKFDALSPFITRIDFGYANVSAVPVPGAIWLFGTGLLGLVGFKWRRKAA
jgi:hypothetical protein